MATRTPTYRQALAAARTEAIEVLRAAMRATTLDDTGAPVPTSGARLAASTLLRLAARDLDDDEDTDDPAASDTHPAASPNPPPIPDHPSSHPPRPTIHDNVEPRANAPAAPPAAANPLITNFLRAATPSAAATLLSRAGAAPPRPPPRSRSPAA